MLNDVYDITSTTRSSDLHIYKFKSTGAKGIIEKIVEFRQTHEGPETYNLALGDLEGGNLNDSVRSNNGDRDKILATVALITIHFLEVKPTATVYATGSSDSRTRLYQIGLNRYYSDICEEYDLLGRLEENKWEPFELNKNYNASEIRKKR